MSDVLTKDPIDISIDEYKDEMIRNLNIRNKGIKILEQSISELTINPKEDKPSLIEAKLGIINALSGLADANDSARNKFVNVMLKRKDSESNENIAAVATEILKRIKPTDFGLTGGGPTNIDDPTINSDIARSYDAEKNPITDAELESDDFDINIDDVNSLFEEQKD